MNARFVPIETWPGEKRRPGQRRKSPFEAPWARTLVDLDRELGHLRAKDILIWGYFRDDDIRLDGWPRSESRPREPGVIVSFASPQGDLSFPCDTYLTWQENLRAIALGLAALRAVERYGVTRHQEQYKGWAKLPPAPARMDPHDALTFLTLHSDGLPPAKDAESLNASYRRAAARLHPDNAATGNVHLFHLLSQAKEVLVESYGWA
jgi:hypothetical protein